MGRKGHFIEDFFFFFLLTIEEMLPLKKLWIAPLEPTKKDVVIMQGFGQKCVLCWEA